MGADRGSVSLREVEFCEVINAVRYFVYLGYGWSMLPDSLLALASGLWLVPEAGAMVLVPNHP